MEFPRRPTSTPSINQKVHLFWTPGRSQVQREIKSKEVRVVFIGVAVFSVMNLLREDRIVFFFGMREIGFQCFFFPIETRDLPNESNH